MEVPNPVWLMIVLYVIAHMVMSQTVFGRYVYAIGGNKEAARLSGVPVKLTLLIVYTVCGALSGLGGVVLASQLEAGDPKFGLMYELEVIAAVVVGGTSLMGGQGKIFGTLIGAFIIAVIKNGMNLMNVDPFNQRIVLGAVLLAAVLLDQLKRRTSLSCLLVRGLQAENFNHSITHDLRFDVGSGPVFDTNDALIYQHSQAIDHSAASRFGVGNQPGAERIRDHVCNDHLVGQTLLIQGQSSLDIWEKADRGRIDDNIGCRRDREFVLPADKFSGSRCPIVQESGQFRSSLFVAVDHRNLFGSGECHFDSDRASGSAGTQ